VKKKEIEINFEEGMRKLDGIVEKLEKGNIPLEEALKQFDSGVQLVRLLNRKLDDAERKIEMLLKNKDGNVIKKEMEFENGELKEKIVDRRKQTEDRTPETEDRGDIDYEDNEDDEGGEDDEGNSTPSLF
jgi:exodeoxyribonuclease VII small subunit